MLPPAPMEQRTQPVFASLPPELFLNVLDQLVGTPDGRRPIAYAPSDPITKALRALTLVSHNTYLVASRYLYANCLCLYTCTSYTMFRRTLGLGLENHPHALEYGVAGRNDRLFYEAGALRHVTSLFMSPHKTEKCGNAPLVRLSQVIDFGLAIGPTLKRLIMDTMPVYTPASDIQQVKPYTATNNIFLHMPSLEELICSYDVTDFFPHPPPNLKRLAMTFQDMDDSHLSFCFATSTLETLFFLRPGGLSAADIDELFERYSGYHLDVVLVDVSANHVTPVGSREWTDTDRVIIWEADVPKSYYGDEDDVLLCDEWIWTHGGQGTLWDQEKRRMTCWKEIEQDLAQLHDGYVP